MTLQERLDAAEADRRRAAGLPLLPAPAPTDDRAESGAGDNGFGPLPVLDLRPSAPVIDLRGERSWAKRLTVALNEGECPECAGEVRLDIEDVVGGVNHLHCLGCGLLFQVARLTPRPQASNPQP